MNVYQNILKGQIQYPDNGSLNSESRNLIAQLLVADPSCRLGHRDRGIKDIMSHHWFDDVVWERLLDKSVDAPYLPPTKTHGDDFMYDHYQEDEDYEMGMGEGIKDDDGY